MNIYLPSQFKLNSVNEIISKTIQIDRNPISDTYNFEFAFLKFIEPAGITAFFNVLEYLIKKGSKIYFNIDPNRAKYDTAIKYLDDINFFSHFLGQKLNPNSNIRSTTLALEKIPVENCTEWVDSKLLPWLNRQLSLGSTLKLQSIKLCMMEIFNNIVDHSNENIACLYAQHYPKANEIHIAVSDFGVGIPTSVRKVIDFDLDTYAIRKAVEEGFSSMSTPQNRGAGLDLLMKNIVHNNSGIMTILSNGAKVDFFKIKNPEEKIGCYEKNFNLSQYPGTLLQLTLNTNLFKGDDLEPEDFIW